MLKSVLVVAVIGAIFISICVMIIKGRGGIGGY